MPDDDKKKEITSLEELELASGEDNVPNVGRSDQEACNNKFLRYSVSDKAPLFQVLFYLILGFKSAAEYHDVAMSPDVNGEKSPVIKAISIPPYFLLNYYGAIGTILDFKNYGK